MDTFKPVVENIFGDDCANLAHNDQYYEETDCDYHFKKENIISWYRRKDSLDELRTVGFESGDCEKLTPWIN